MKEQLQDILSLLTDQGADYADIRVHDIQEENIATENNKVQSLSTAHTYGYGIRVFVDGALGFAGSQEFENMEATAKRALAIARASRGAQKQPARLAPRQAVVDDYQTPVKIDPFTVSKEQKLALLFAAEAEMRKAVPDLFKTFGSLLFRREEKIFADTEGAYITQTLFMSGGGIEATAANQQDVQKRSFPNSFRGDYGTAGYEYVEELGLVENAARVAREAKALLEAEECPSGHFDLVIDSDQLTLQIHESIGHPIELDRVFGHEAGLAGTSFLNPDKLGFRYGSEHVNVVADATVPQGLGTFGYDDEGVKAQRTPIITKGIFANFISSRDTASVLNQPSNGTARADGWGRIPIVRMTNINLLPGDKEVDELIAGVEYGFYLATNKSWSIDDKRLNFQFACEIAYEIKDGKLTGKIFKNPIYTGITPEFWNACDGVASEKHWQLHGTPNCGKGEPMQVARVGHGSAPARFRNIKVGVADVK
ncbi:MAG: TldD/PmbA family protein [Firmicutes bacterium]|nr:TldD/PmbA family protein [Bacillota bacterium]